MQSEGDDLGGGVSGKVGRPFRWSEARLMELREALTQISEIRRQMARTEVFRGYRAMPVAFSGLLALRRRGSRRSGSPTRREHLTAYLALWVGTAVVSAVAAGLRW